MPSYIHKISLCLLFSFQLAVSQTVQLQGKVESASEIENIHVINKSKQLFTVTNRLGEFGIKVSLGDTLQFSSIQHKPLEIKVTEEMVSKKSVSIELKELVNELDEVIVGKILTGDLNLDIGNMEGDPPINFVDLGIPGYTGKIATQSERRLSEAGEFKPSMLMGLLGGGIPLNPILNGISGRTKKLKKRVEVEEKEALVQKIKTTLGKDFFASNPLAEDLQMDFFYFCSDDENFIVSCKNQTDFNILIFLRKKYLAYLENRNLSED